MKRGDVVYLAKTEARCAPSGYCKRQSTCARYLVAPDQGRPVVDYTLQSIGYGVAVYCAGWMDASKHRDPPPSQGGPRVHEAPGWLK